MRITYLLFSLSFLFTCGTSSLYSMETPDKCILEGDAENKQATFGEPFKISIQELYGKALETNSLLLLVYTYAQLLYSNKEQYSTLKTLGQTFLDALKIQLEMILEKVERVYSGQSKPMDYRKCVQSIFKSLKVEELTAEIFTVLKERTHQDNSIALLMAHVFAFLEKSPAFSLFLSSPAVTLTLKDETSYTSILLYAYYLVQAQVRYSSLDIFKVDPTIFDRVYDYARSLQKQSLFKEEAIASGQLEETTDVLEFNVRSSDANDVKMLLTDKERAFVLELNEMTENAEEETLGQKHAETHKEKKPISNGEKILWAQNIARTVVQKGIKLEIESYEKQLIKELTHDQLEILHSFARAHTRDKSVTVWMFIAYKLCRLPADVRQMVFAVLGDEQLSDLSLLEDMIEQLK